MQIFSTFEHCTFLELAIATLEQHEIKKENILAVPLNYQVGESQMFDTVHSSDGISLFDKGAMLGTAFSVVGASIGFALEWGPIFWGLIGLVVGFFSGFGIDLFIYKVVQKRKNMFKKRKSEVILIVQCEKSQIKM